MLASKLAVKTPSTLNPDFPSGLPSLPEIKDPALLEQAFTHRSFLGRPVETFSDSSQPRDYESLEHLGDSVLNLSVTDIIRKKYPDARPGGATIIRAKVINNSNLASIAHRYEFGPRMRVNITQEAVLREAGSLLADMFEAYIGAVYTEQGFDRTAAWLGELLTPYIHLAYSEALSEQHTGVSSGALMKINQMLQRANLKAVKWAEKKDENGNWRMDAVIEGRHVGRGVATSKARAKNIAAELALKTLEAENAVANNNAA